MKKIIVSLVSLVLMLGMVGAVSAADLLLVTVDSVGRPTLEGTITTDGASIIFDIRAVGQADDGDNINQSRYYGQHSFDNEYFTISAAGKFLKYNMFMGNTTPGWGTSWGDAINPLPGGVTFSQTADGDDFVYAVSMSYAVLGISEGDTFSVQIKARDFNDDYVQSYVVSGGDDYVGYDGEYSHYNGIYVTDTGVFDVMIPTPMVPMASFVIDHAKIDFKKKADDDKVRVQGKLALDLTNGDGAVISDDVTVTVGTLSQIIRMVEKGKKGDKWEYKRPKGKGGEGNIKHMKIDWKNGKFDIRMDKAELNQDTLANPVIISIQIGDDFGKETIKMREKKHHWDYKAGKHSLRAEPTESTQASKAEESIAQSKFGLSQNYPNPFNPETTIEYDIEKGCDVTLKIYNLAGQMVKTLVDEYQTVGHYTITWHGDTDAGQEIASGVYFYRIKAGDKAAIKKMVVLK